MKSAVKWFQICFDIKPRSPTMAEISFYPHLLSDYCLVLTFALAGSVLISWMRKVSGLTMITRGMPVVCCTQHTRPGWFMTSDHWHRAGDNLLLPPLELRGEKKETMFSVTVYILVARKSKINMWFERNFTLWCWWERASALRLCYGSLWQQKTFLDCS